MLFSIITVCQNAAATLEAARQSLVDQRFRDFEWIVIDGCSDDQTLDIVRSYDAGPVRVVSEPDSGIYNAMNKGVRLAQGKFIYFLNADDSLFDGDVLASLAAEMSQSQSTQLYFGNVVYQRLQGADLRRFDHIDARTLLYEDLCHQAVFANRLLFDSVGQFNEEFRLNADYDWLIRVFRAGARYRWIDRTIARFTVGGTHLRNFQQLVDERRKVRLQYMGAWALAVGSVRTRLRYRVRRICRSTIRGGSVTGQ